MTTGSPRWIPEGLTHRGVQRSDGSPAGFFRVPLEYLHTGLEWLLDQPGVAGSRAGVIGYSKGAELALLLGSYFPEVGAVVAGAPSGVVWQGGPASLGVGSSWTYNGDELAYVPMVRPETLASGWAGPVRVRESYESALADVDAVRRAEIAVERTGGPILMISGGRDAQWPSTPMAEFAEERAKRLAFGDIIMNLRYPDAGHLIGVPGVAAPHSVVHPVAELEMLLDGGTPGASSRASADSWFRSIEFLRQALS
jgi:dienelactone hydrolase